jgi:hypothetical protein
MKHVERLVIAVRLLALPIRGIVGCTALGLKKQTPQTVVYNSLSTVGNAVNSSYAGYMDQVVAGKAPFNVTYC